jgi:hypothetical protein
MENKLLDLTVVVWMVIMTFELANSPKTFHRLMNNVLRHYLDNFSIVRRDIILIYKKCS